MYSCCRFFPSLFLYVAFGGMVQPNPRIRIVSIGSSYYFRGWGDKKIKSIRARGWGWVFSAFDSFGRLCFVFVFFKKGKKMGLLVYFLPFSIPFSMVFIRTFLRRARVSKHLFN